MFSNKKNKTGRIAPAQVKSINYYKKIEILSSKLPHKMQVEFALSCAKDVRHLVDPKDKDIVDKALATVELWLMNKATAKDCFDAANGILSASSYSAYYVAYYASRSDSSLSTTDAFAHHAAYYAVYYAASYDIPNTYAANKEEKYEEYYLNLVQQVNSLSKLELLIYNINMEELGL